jgi:hypothetical protein
MPCPSTGPKTFCTGPNFLYWTKICLDICLCQTKREFVFSFSDSTKFLGVALNAKEFLVRHKIFGQAQNSLEPVEGQGISFLPSYKRINDIKTSSPNLSL